MQIDKSQFSIIPLFHVVNIVICTYITLHPEGIDARNNDTESAAALIACPLCSLMADKDHHKDLGISKTGENRNKTIFAPVLHFSQAVNYLTYSS